jgi:hypothetical protein
MRVATRPPTHLTVWAPTSARVSPDRAPRQHAARAALKPTPSHVSTVSCTPHGSPPAHAALAAALHAALGRPPSLLVVSNTVEDAYKRPWPPLARASRVAAVSRSATLAIAVAEPSCLSAPSSGRLVFPTPRLDPTGAKPLAHYPTFRRASPDIRPPRPTPPSSVTQPRQCRHSPNSNRICDLGELAHLPHLFPGRERRRPRRIPVGRAAPLGQGLNCRASILSRGLSAKQGHMCES